MRVSSDVRLGVILAVTNVMVFAAILAARPPQYEEIRQLEIKRNGPGPYSFTSADPYYIAARAFYPHGPEPMSSSLYFLLNAPAEFVTLTVALDLYPSLERALAPDLPSSDVRDSWVYAIVFACCAALQAFVVGGIISRWKSRE